LDLASNDHQTRTRVFTSDELLQGRREAWIEHRGEMYRLRLTGSGKLYLTK
jgi:hemin uptake protein HemP